MRVPAKRLTGKNGDLNSSSWPRGESGTYDPCHPACAWDRADRSSYRRVRHLGQDQGRNGTRYGGKAQ